MLVSRPTTAITRKSNQWQTTALTIELNSLKKKSAIRVLKHHNRGLKRCLGGKIISRSAQQCIPGPAEPGFKIGTSINAGRHGGGKRRLTASSSSVKNRWPPYEVLTHQAPKDALESELKQSARMRWQTFPCEEVEAIMICQTGSKKQKAHLCGSGKEAAGEKRDRRIVKASPAMRMRPKAPLRGG